MIRQNSNSIGYFDAHSTKERDLMIEALRRFLACQTPDKACKCAPNDEDFEFARKVLSTASCISLKRSVELENRLVLVTFVFKASPSMSVILGGCFNPAISI